METTEILIRPMLEADWEAVCSIYRAGIATQMATFETEIPTWDSWNEKHLPLGRFVACRENQVIGWLALSPVSTRAVYRGVAELSVYIAPHCQGCGVGQQLMEALILWSETAGFWTLQSAIFPENEASIRLHLRNGFRRIGYREKIAQLQGVWKDNVLMERRSAKP